MIYPTDAALIKNPGMPKAFPLIVFRRFYKRRKDTTRSSQLRFGQHNVFAKHSFCEIFLYSKKINTSDA
jgi:hypothetical protein